MKFLNQMINKGVVFALILTMPLMMTNCYSETDPQKPALNRVVDDLSAQTPYAENKEKDALDDRPYYDKYVEGMGAEKTEYLYQELGQEQMDLLSYGAGVSNVVALVNVILDTKKLVALVGNDYDTPVTGLGPMRMIAMLNAIDSMMLVKTYEGSLPRKRDTIQQVGILINNLNIDTVVHKVVGLINSMGIARNMAQDADEQKMAKLGKLMAHVTDVYKMVNILNAMTAETVTRKLKDVLHGVSDVGKMVAVIDETHTTSKLVDMLEMLTSTENLVTIINNIPVESGSKLGYVLEHVVSAHTLTAIVNSISESARMSELINEMEDGTVWPGQRAGAQSWAGLPHGPDSGMVRLVKTVNALSSAANSAKLVQLIDVVKDMTKMMRVMQDLNSLEDIVLLVQELEDPAINPVPSKNLGGILNNVRLEKIPQVTAMLNGQRAFKNTGIQEHYVKKLARLVKNIDPAKKGDIKVGAMVEGITNPDKIVDLVYEAVVTENISTIINTIDQGSNAWPKDNSVNTLVYVLEHLPDASKLIFLINNSSVANVVTLVNGIAAGSQWSDIQASRTQGTVDDRGMAGKKVHQLVRDIADTSKLTCFMNNANTEKAIVVLNETKLVDISKLVTLLNDASCDKMVVVVNTVSSMPDIAAVIGGITEPKKLSEFIQLTTDPNHVASLLNTVIKHPDTGNGDLIGLMNTVSIDDISKLATLVNKLAGTKDDLVVGLMSPYASDASKGVGYQDIAALISELNDDATAERLASLMLSLNNEIAYNFSSISQREGMVRLLKAGVEFELGDLGGEDEVVHVPGLTASYIASMMNTAADANRLVTLLNSLGLDQLGPIVGCVDALQGFNTACTQIGMGW